MCTSSSLDTLETSDEPSDTSSFPDGPRPADQEYYEAWLNDSSIPQPHDATLPLQRPTAQPPSYAARLHEAWRERRIAVYEALTRLHAEGDVSQKALEAFEHCGKHWWVQKHISVMDRFRVCPSRCNHRWCPACADIRARDVSAWIREELVGGPWRLLTLTVAGANHDLRYAITRLYQSFKRLRQTPLFRSNVTGGIAVLEMTYSTSLERWHPHLHVLIRGTFLPQRALAHAWYEATGDSFIVHITRVQSQTAAHKYVAKYLGKPVPEHVYYDPALLLQAIAATRSLRRVVTFGDCHRRELRKDEDPSCWVTIGNSATLRHSRLVPERIRAAAWAAIGLAMDTGGVLEFDDPEPPVRVSGTPPGAARSPQLELW